MNTLTRKLIRESEKYLGRRQKKNVVRLNTHNSLEHEMKKAEVCYNLMSHGHHFVCEAELKGGGIADVLVLDASPPIAYEVVCTETDERLEGKRESWKPIRVKRCDV